MGTDRLRLVVLGMMGRSPFGGQTWLYLNWLVGLCRLGHDVWYIEDDAAWPYDPEENALTNGGYAVRHIYRVLRHVGMEDRWAFRLSSQWGRCEGPVSDRIDELYRSSDALLNIVGATRIRKRHRAAPFRVVVETDPVIGELLRATRDRVAIAMYESHHAMATYGENYGAPDCGVPVDGMSYVTTRQPIDLDFWRPVYTPDAPYFTTIGNYRQPGNDVVYQGERYRWSKHHEWERFIDLPRATPQQFQLALYAKPHDVSHLREHGWNVVPTVPMSLDVFGAYPDYIRGSRAEFTVAKDQNVRLRSGWFSERDVCYLASGKPVIAQDTGFGNVLPTGEGLFAFTTLDEAVAAIEAINHDYKRHCRAARAIAEEYFAAEKVAAKLLASIGLA